MPDALKELKEVLLSTSIPIETLIRGGGGEAESTQHMRRSFNERGWYKKNIVIRKFIDEVEVESLSHEIDHVKSFSGSTFALEIEWNNKDPFFDRDLENFKRLHAEGAISIGGIITRGKSLQNNLLNLMTEFASSNAIRDFTDLEPFGYLPTQRQKTNVRTRQANGTPFAEAWAKVFVSDKFGTATTHWDKLLLRVNRGVGNPCPLLLLGLPAEIVDSTPRQ